MCVSWGHVFQNLRRRRRTRHVWGLSTFYFYFLCSGSLYFADSTPAGTARTMFWILKSVKRAGKSSFWMMRAYLRAA